MSSTPHPGHRPPPHVLLNIILRHWHCPPVVSLVASSRQLGVAQSCCYLHNSDLNLSTFFRAITFSSDPPVKMTVGLIYSGTTMCQNLTGFLTFLSLSFFSLQPPVTQTLSIGRPYSYHTMIRIDELRLSLGLV